MTGPEHYREAEHHIKLAAASELNERNERYHLAIAQAHATLALAAATAADQATSYDGDETHARSRGWAGVA